MNKLQHSKTSLLLMEMMINLLFFCILVSICTQFFVKSHNIRISTTELTHGVNLITSTAECYRGTEGSFTEFAGYYPDAEADESAGILTIYYDSDFQMADSDSYAYYIRVSCSSTSNDSTADLSLYKRDAKESIYSLTTHLHRKIDAGGDTNA